MRSRTLAEIAASACRAVLAIADRLPRWIHVVSAVAWGAFLWHLSARPGTGGPKTLSMTWLWNSAHVVAYFALGALCFFAIRLRTARDPAGQPFGDVHAARRRGLMAAVVGTVYGILDEWHQSYVPGRACSLWDMGSDVLGACLAVSIFLWSEWRVGSRWVWIAAGLAVMTVSGATRAAF